MAKAMTVGARERTLTRALVGLADTLVSDFDVADLLHDLVVECVGLLDVDAGGLLLSDQRGGLEVMASSSEQTRLLELFQVQAAEGPCLECFRSGEQIAVSDLTQAVERWPKFVPAAQAAGYAAVHAIPLRLRNEIIGALNLFAIRPHELSEEDSLVAQALADVATIGILQERTIHHREMVVEQLQGALNSRIVIEQAKGLLAEAGGLQMDEAFDVLRKEARSMSSLLAAVARDLVEGRLDANRLVAKQKRARAQAPG